MQRSGLNEQCFFFYFSRKYELRTCKLYTQERQIFFFSVLFSLSCRIYIHYYVCFVLCCVYMINIYSKIFERPPFSFIIFFFYWFCVNASVFHICLNIKPPVAGYCWQVTEKKKAMAFIQFSLLSLYETEHDKLIMETLDNNTICCVCVSIEIMYYFVCLSACHPKNKCVLSPSFFFLHFTWSGWLTGAFEVETLLILVPFFFLLFYSHSLSLLIFPDDKISLWLMRLKCVQYL